MEKNFILHFSYHNLQLYRVYLSPYPSIQDSHLFRVYRTFRRAVQDSVNSTLPKITAAILYVTLIDQFLKSIFFQTFPNDDISDALGNVFDFDGYSENSLEVLSEVFFENGIPTDILTKTRKTKGLFFLLL